MNERHLRRTITDASHKVWRRGWVANHDGNLSARIERGRFVATPSGVSKEVVTEDSLLIVDEKGELLGRGGKVFSEFALHTAVYRKRPDVQAVIHAHPPLATGMAVVGQGLDEPFLAEAVVSLGPRVPLIPFAPPGDEAGLAAVSTMFAEVDAALLENHGVLTVGDTVEQAYLRMELVEHLARILAAARQFGQPQALHPSVIARLLEARRRAGLGPEARGVRSTLPAVPSTTGQATSERAAVTDRDELTELITREITRILGA